MSAEATKIINKDSTAKSGRQRSVGRSLVLPVVIVLQLVAVYFLTTLVLLPIYHKYIGQKPVADDFAKGGSALGEVFIIEDLTVNPIDSNGRRFAVFEVAIECRNREVYNLVKRYEPKIKDEFISYLRSKTVAELGQPAAMEITRKELHRCVNRMLEGNKVENIYFTEFVLQ